MEDYRFLPNLSQNLLTILNDDEYYDVTIEVGKDPYVKVFRAHMVILTYRSPYLRRILSTNVKKNDGTLAHIKLPNISPETFQIILRYIYGGRLSLKEYDVSDIIKILIVANELNLQEIVTYLQSFLIVNKKNWMEQNFNLIYKTSFENESLLKLQNFCTELITKEPSKIFKSIDFNSISEKTLISLIRHENLKMSNVQVWEHVLKWGIAQNPELSSDPSSYSKNDFNALKNTLQQCIPFIKFYNLTSREFLNKVYPYRKIIPKDLLDKLFRYFLDHEHKPNNKPEQKVAKEISSKAIDSRIITLLDHEHKCNKPEQKVTKEISSKPIDSRIITFQHVEIISKWIDKLDITDNIKNSYEFKLILRGSRDGFLPRKFHEICDNQSHTISIIKVQGSNEILGGYNPNIWVSNWCHIAEKDSFIFSFKNKNSIENYILSRVKVEQYAIFNNPNHGPSFGSGLVLFGNDFFSMSYCKNMKKYPNYEKSIRETEKTFSVEEYEIFQITKN